MFPFLRQNPVRCKIVVDNKCYHKVENFKHLGCEISYENKNVVKKNSNFFSNNGNSNNTLKAASVQKFAGIEVHTALAIPIPLYGREISTLRESYKKD